MQPELVGAPGQRGEPVAGEPVAVLEQLDARLGVRRSGHLAGEDHAALLDDAAAHRPRELAAPGRTARRPRRSCAPAGRGTASGRPRAARGARRTAARRPSPGPAGGRATAPAGPSSRRSRTSAVSTMWRPRGIVARKCGLSTTSTSSSRCRTSIANGTGTSSGRSRWNHRNSRGRYGSTGPTGPLRPTIRPSRSIASSRAAGSRGSRSTRWSRIVTHEPVVRGAQPDGVEAVPLGERRDGGHRAIVRAGSVGLPVSGSKRVHIALRPACRLPVCLRSR